MRAPDNGKGEEQCEGNGGAARLFMVEVEGRVNIGLKRAAHEGQTFTVDAVMFQLHHDKLTPRLSAAHADLLMAQI